MNISVKQGNLQVVQTGTVLISNNEPTTILIDNNYRIEIKYTDEAENKDQNISAHPIENGVAIELKNFNNPLGTTTTTPLPIATRGTQTISISLTVTAIGVAKILYYGIYLGK